MRRTIWKISTILTFTILLFLGAFFLLPAEIFVQVHQEISFFTITLMMIVLNFKIWNQIEPTNKEYSSIKQADRAVPICVNKIKVISNKITLQVSEISNQISLMMEFLTDIQAQSVFKFQPINQKNTEINSKTHILMGYNPVTRFLELFLKNDIQNYSDISIAQLIGFITAEKPNYSSKLCRR
jgi:hypothetical protein